jgi:hypothetical protein
METRTSWVANRIDRLELYRDRSRYPRLAAISYNTMALDHIVAVA